MAPQLLHVLAILLLCISTTYCTSKLAKTTNLTQATLAVGPASNSDQSENNIAFDLPDLTITIETNSGEFQLEAYKSITNDQILREENELLSKKISQLIWVSVGQPMFVKTTVHGTTEAKLFHSTTTGFYSFIQMLTTSHRKMLATTASFKYGVRVSENQLVNLILSKLECSLVLYSDAGNKYLIKGTVINFRSFPLRIHFVAPPNSVERKLFVKQLTSSDDENADLEFICNMASRGKVMRTNTLAITTQQMQQIGFEEKLFGTSPSVSDVFVTRDQTTALASEMYSTLNIVEDYEMPELQFQEAFVEDLINQAAVSHFTMTPIDTVLASLSKYQLDISGDLKADVIKKDLGEVLKVDKSDSKSHIILTDEYSKKYDESTGVTRGGSFGGFLGISASAKYGRNNAKSDAVNTKSLSDQLNELNTLSQNDIKWEIEGEKVIPKSLNVARMSRSKLSKTLTFRRVRIQSFNAPFDRDFALYTEDAKPMNNRLLERVDQLTTSFDELAIHLNQFKSTYSSLIGAIQQSTNLAVNDLYTTVRQQETNWAAKFQQLSTKISSLSHVQDVISSRRTISRCRVCFWEAEGSSQCQQARSTCSGWSDSPAWTTGFRDDTDERDGGCSYHWKIECE